MAQPRTLYEDGRPYTVPHSLEELTGPTEGVVELPMRLDWSEQGRYDLSDPRERNLMYERVIRESMQVEDLRAYLHGPTLRRVWHQLWLPRKVRGLWEARFQALAGCCRSDCCVELDRRLAVVGPGPARSRKVTKAMSPIAHFGHWVVLPPASPRHVCSEWSQTHVILGV
jgi:hypothetical protein